MNRDMQAAMEWLDRHRVDARSTKYVETIIDYMAFPVMPPEPSEETFEAMRRSISGGMWVDMAAIYRALYVQLAKPRMRMEWTVRGWGRRKEPDHYSLTVDSQEKMHNAIDALRGDGYERIDITQRAVRV